MRAVRFEGPGRLSLVELPDPEPATGWARIRTQAAAIYALGLIGPDASDSWKEILRLSTNPDYNLRRECARALALIGAGRREVRMRLEEMTMDVDDIVKDHARRGLSGRL